MRIGSCHWRARSKISDWRTYYNEAHPHSHCRG
ncbi:TPA: transposase [Burkholderia vietnamiensis]|nr:integrase core domain-containing protein [Burkholderia vietnamiensis]MBR8084268.1 integrase core domain-containing protein [Burkholderia vietnamiensis]MBR8191063.1 integrase core domain-containing protein [Burkholderia vietnamiensis]MBR8228999.1 integrase core domain-containing protein [Burkholderia vietnamiensis]RQM52839.1 hypothetical protein EHZ18_26330 [Burkholderia vietnamiensis]